MRLSKKYEENPMVDDGQLQQVVNRLESQIRDAKQQNDNLRRDFERDVEDLRQQQEGELTRLQSKFFRDLDKIERDLRKQLETSEKQFQSQLQQIRDTIANRELSQRQQAQTIIQEAHQLLTLIQKNNLLRFETTALTSYFTNQLKHMDVYLQTSPEAAVGIAVSLVMAIETHIQTLRYQEAQWKTQHLANQMIIKTLEGTIKHLQGIKTTYEAINQDTYELKLDVDFWVDGQFQRDVDQIRQFKEELKNQNVKLETLKVSNQQLQALESRMPTYESMAISAVKQSLKTFEIASYLKEQLINNAFLLYVPEHSGYLRNLGKLESDPPSYHLGEIRLVFLDSLGRRIFIHIDHQSLLYHFEADEPMDEHKNEQDMDFYSSLLNQHLIKQKQPRYQSSVSLEKKQSGIILKESNQNGGMKK